MPHTHHMSPHSLPRFHRDICSARAVSGRHSGQLHPSVQVLRGREEGDRHQSPTLPGDRAGGRVRYSHGHQNGRLASGGALHPLPNRMRIVPLRHIMLCVAERGLPVGANHTICLSILMKNHDTVIFVK